MLSPFRDAIVAKAPQFTPAGGYRTITRANGAEIITVSDRTIKVTKLGVPATDPNSTVELATKLTFDPKEILMNQCEQLLCVYDEENCWMITLNKEGSTILFTTHYALDLKLAKDEKLIQVIFNNVSKYQSEVVALTTKEIRSYDTFAPTMPLQRYDFKQEYENNTSKNAFDFESSIVDPVSICFASHSINASFLDEVTPNSPQNDLTLFLLTSDSSVYKIFPFFPQRLSVNMEWVSDLFDSTSLSFRSLNMEAEQATLLPAVKVSAMLEKAVSPESILIRKELPTTYQRGKLTGPLTIESFPEELYAFDAIKLLAMPNDLLIIVFNHAIVAFHRSSQFQMIFEHQNVEPNDTFLLMDTSIFSPGSGSICTAMIHPVTADSIIVTASNGTVLQVDFSQWMENLTMGLQTGDLTVFTEQCQSEQLPTVVVKLGTLALPEENSVIADVTLRSYENLIWSVWNTREVYTMFKKAGNPEKLEVSLISASANDEEENGEVEDGNVNEAASEKYQSLLTSDYQKHFLPQIEQSLAKINEVVKRMNETPTRLLDENNTTSADLKAVYDMTELATTGQLILFKVLAEISKRLKMTTMEFHQQLAAYNSAIMKKETIFKNFLKLKGAFLDASERQRKLVVRMTKMMHDTEILEAKENKTAVCISYQENAYFKELARMKDYVLRKESESEELNKLLSDVEAAETETLLKNKDIVLGNFDNRENLKSLKTHLETQSTFIDYLIERLSRLNRD